MRNSNNLPIIQKTYDFVKWYVPILDKLPRNHKFLLGDRIVSGLYELLENLILARYEQNKLGRLTLLNGKLDILRHQSRLLLDFNLVNANRYENISQKINDIGIELGGWIKHQKNKTSAPSAVKKF